MSQRDGFIGGFFLGTVVGGVVGGILGAVVATRRRTQELDEENPSLIPPGKGTKFETEESIEIARRSLEDKIAQLNNAIDDVRQQLGPLDSSPPSKD